MSAGVVAAQDVWPGGRTLFLVGTLGLLGTGLAVDVLLGHADNPFLPVIALTTVLDTFLSDAVLRRRPGHPVGRVFRVAAVVGVVVVATGAWADAALFGPLPQAGAAWSLWLNRWLWVALAGATVALLFAFPDGHLPTPRWRPVAWLAAACVLLFVAQAMAEPFSESTWRPVPVTNPVAPALGDLGDALGWWPSVAFVVATACGAAAVVARRAAADGDLRERLRWVLPPALLLPPAMAVSLLGPWAWGGVGEMLVTTALAVAVTVATVRHRMYDADVAVNRAVVYGLLLASLLSAYVAVVVVVSRVAARLPWLPGVAGAAVVAVAFGPLLHRLRSAVDQLLFGSRRAPDEVVTLIREAGDEPGDDRQTLARAAETTRAALRLPWVRIEAGGIDVTSGEPRTTATTVPLRRGHRELGSLHVGRRYDGERVRAADPVLAAVAAQLAITVDALRSAAELRTAHDRLLTARETERRRIRRDLHDGLGPTLAGVCLGLESAEALAASDPVGAAGTLPALSRHARQAVDDVRRLVDGLTPAELDGLGLLDGIRNRLAPLVAGAAPAITLQLPPSLPPLPETTELATFWIVLEAVTNAVRHAQADTCEVRIGLRDAQVVLEVVDDGRGLGEAAPHVGLVSMRERAEEAGGRLLIQQRPEGGTVVRAELPAGAGPTAGAGW